MLEYLVSLQGYIQSFLHPGTWLPFAKKYHSEEAEWTFSQPKSTITTNEAMDAVWSAAQTLDYFVARTKNDSNDTMVIDTFTKAKWMDQIIFKFGSGTAVVVHVEASSTGVFPLIIPFAPILNIFFAFVPFKDFGKNYSAMEKLRKETEKIMDSNIETKTIRRSLGNPRRKEKKQ
mmetsp:Transcript_25884/g.34363  ORF Transcript_25884/g.34363 Transcript_25884/m.34363 type:complete len:175 (-) Transcript_25884:1-525(-)